MRRRDFLASATTTALLSLPRPARSQDKRVLRFVPQANLTSLERTRLLIIDDWGPEPLTAEQRRDLLEIIDDRDQRSSLLITS